MTRAQVAEGGSATNNAQVAEGGSATNNAQVAEGGSATNNAQVATGGSATNNAQVATGGSATNSAQVATGDSATNNARIARGGSANPARGEASFVIAGQTHVLRPTFTALVAAEDELGPLFALVERAGNGELRLTEIAALFWHCCAPRGALTRADVGEAVMQAGLAAASAPLRVLLGQILQGRAR